LIAASVKRETEHTSELMNRLIGLVLVAISAASFGTLAILGRYAYADGMDAPTILFLRFSLAAMVLAPLQAARREAVPPAPTLVRLVGMGALGYVGQAMSYLTALKYASSGLVALLLYLYPICVAILSATLLREKITRPTAAALGLALLGLALTVGPEGGHLLGILLAIAAAIIYSVYILVGTQVLKQVSPIQSSTIIFASAGAASGLLMFATGPHWPASTAGWVTIGAIVIVATVVPVVTFLGGLRRIGPTNAALLSTLEPAVTVVLAATLLGERLKPLSLLGGGLILLAVALLTRHELGR
jgi:drug/metabolite transporter (DMT)-like permease